MLKEFRIGLGITIKEAATAVGIPFRTYIRYEKDDSYGSSLKRESIYRILNDEYQISETKGVLTVNTISELLAGVFNKHKNEIEFCYLFGSYAKGYAREDSDVDLCISTSLTGLGFVALLDEVCTALKKKVDLIRLLDLSNNMELINEIMKGGIRIYG